MQTVTRKIPPLGEGIFFARTDAALAFFSDLCYNAVMFKILIVEDSTNLQKLYATILRTNGYTTLTANNGQEALEMLKKEHIDLMILDVMMPVMDGYELTEILRQGGSELPILMITAKTEKADKKAGFLVGIDDYMTKPVDEEEMLLRIKALLRRSKIVAERKLEIGSTELRYDSLTVACDGVEETLPKKEFYLLYKLLSYPGQIFTKFQLLDEIWGLENESDNTLNVHINRLRNRFENNRDFEIVTVRGIGFKAVRKSEDGKQEEK